MTIVNTMVMLSLFRQTADDGLTQQNVKLIW